MLSTLPVNLTSKFYPRSDRHGAAIFAMTDPYPHRPISCHWLPAQGPHKHTSCPSSVVTARLRLTLRGIFFSASAVRLERSPGELREGGKRIVSEAGRGSSGGGRCDPLAAQDA